MTRDRREFTAADVEALNQFAEQWNRAAAAAAATLKAVLDQVWRDLQPALAELQSLLEPYKHTEPTGRQRAASGRWNQPHAHRAMWIRKTRRRTPCKTTP